MARKVVIRFFLVFALVTAVIVSTAVSQPAAEVKGAAGITSGLTIEKVEFGAEDPISLRFTLTNTTDQPVNVLKWQTPLEGFTSNMFQVQSDGKKVTYIGRLVKRGAPGPGDYITIAPQESVSSVVDLGDGYAIYKAGDYSVTFKSRLFDIGQEPPSVLAAKREFEPKGITSNTVSFKLVESKQPPAPPAPIPTAVAGAKLPVFKNCSQSKQDTLTNALSEAEQLCARAVNDLKNTPVSKRARAQRYTTWFGTYEQSRYDQVTSNFEKIYDALTNQTITFNCDCSENYYAYVYPHKPYEIYLCNLFWSAPLTGTDSKAGTIIHETSHFYVVAGTDDHAYGHTNCKNLAITDPARAIENADSHEYFAENDPPLSMGLDILVYSLLFIMTLVVMYRLVQNRCRRTN